MPRYEKKPAGRHSAPKGGRPQRPSAQAPRTRREPLRDNYYYDNYQGPGEFEDISSYSSEQARRAGRREMAGKKQPKRPKRRMKLGTKIFLVLILLVCALAGLGVYMFGGLKVRPLEGSLSVDTSARTLGVKTIALFGVDSREGENQGRSDALMVMAVDSRSHTLKMASLMRDSEVYIPEYGYDKLTHAYAYGGPELAIRTLNENFGLDIEDYMTVNFYNMARIVDAFGGVELELSGDEMREVNRNLWNLSQEVLREGGDSGIRDKDYFTATDGTHNMIDGEYIGGRVTLNGNQAVAYSRIRELDGDESRTGRQHRVLAGLVDGARKKTLFSYPGIAHGMMPNCETSLSLGDIAQLAPFALGKIQTESITLPGEEEGAYGAWNEYDSWVLRYDGQLMGEHLRDFLYGE